MSTKAVEAFLGRLNEDPHLAQQLQDDTKDATDPVAIVVGFAARHGHDFTREEFLASQETSGAELTDAQLAGVAGGAGGYIIRRRYS
jgi:predicted ribosomally synthesized peptide with nif11-like leader